MDIQQIATTFTLFISPFIPYLLLAGEEAAKEAGRKFGDAAWRKAQMVWSKSKDHICSDPHLDGAIKVLAADPEDEHFQIAVIKVLLKKLEASRELAIDFHNMLEQDNVTQHILVQNESKVKRIHQVLRKSGSSRVVIIRSEVGDIKQEG